MKTFEKLSHYEVLKIPTHADAEAVAHAYREALEIYGNDSMITYSLFSDSQRRSLLQSIDEAYYTLIDNVKRQAYDRTMIAAGIMVSATPEPAPAPTPNHPPAQPAARMQPVMHRDLHAWVKKKAQEKAVRALIDEVLSRDCISGHDLQRMREAFGIDLAEIYEKTRIAGSILRTIESDRFEALPADIFLRSFLKSYAELLQLEPGRVIEGYFKSKHSAAHPPK